MNHPNLLLGELREFKRATLDWQKRVDKKLDSFNGFKMKVLGAATLAAFAATLIVEWVRH